MADELRIKVSGVDTGEVERALETVDDAKLDTTFDNAVDPVTVAVVLATALAVGKFIFRLINEVRGGTVIDLTKDPVDVRRDKDLNYMFFMVIAKDGTVTIEGKDEPEDAIERMVGKVLELATSTAADIAEAAKKAVSDDAKVEVEPGPAGP